jgi:hypothetical protein
MPHDQDKIALECVRELYDGMSAVIAKHSSISEFMEHVLRDLSGESGPNRIRTAVRRAHQQLGLLQ